MGDAVKKRDGDIQPETPMQKMQREALEEQAVADSGEAAETPMQISADG